MIKPFLTPPTSLRAAQKKMKYDFFEKEHIFKTIIALGGARFMMVGASN